MSGLYFDDSLSIKTWNDFLKLASDFNSGKWLFRGEQKYSWELKTSLERACNDYDIELIKLPQIEQSVIREFHRHLINYSVSNISKYNYFGLMAMMQHYGCPTRLLDFTHSLFIALFFSIEKSKIPQPHNDDDAAIWLINAEWLDVKYKNTASDIYRNALIHDKFEKSEEMMRIILNDKRASIKHIGPYEMNDRMIIQQGTFLIPLDITLSFAENIIQCYSQNEIKENIKKVRIVITKDFLEEMYKNLFRMNITRSTLFPGINGFSEHFRMRILLSDNMNSEYDSFA